MKDKFQRKEYPTYIIDMYTKDWLRKLIFCLNKNSPNLNIFVYDIGFPTRIRCKLSSTFIAKGSSTFTINILAPFLFLHPNWAIWTFLIIVFLHLFIKFVNDTVSIMKWFQAFRTMRFFTLTTQFLSLLHVNHSVAIFHCTWF